ncbi:MAG: hypothetical protein AABX07_05405 [Nanoarchaeota archaeon]
MISEAESFLREPTKKDISDELKRVRGRTPEQKLILWENVMEMVERKKLKRPFWINALNNSEFECNLVYEREFWSSIEVPYYLVDKFWNDLRAGIALWYLEQERG